MITWTWHDENNGMDIWELPELRNQNKCSQSSKELHERRDYLGMVGYLERMGRQDRKYQKRGVYIIGWASIAHFDSLRCCVLSVVKASASFLRKLGPKYFVDLLLYFLFWYWTSTIQRKLINRQPWTPVQRKTWINRWSRLFCKSEKLVATSTTKWD